MPRVIKKFDPDAAQAELDACYDAHGIATIVAEKAIAEVRRLRDGIAAAALDFEVDAMKQGYLAAENTEDRFSVADKAHTAIADAYTKASMQVRKLIQ